VTVAVAFEEEFGLDHTLAIEYESTGVRDALGAALPGLVSDMIGVDGLAARIS
jgi:hypothetical protein